MSRQDDKQTRALSRRSFIATAGMAAAAGGVLAGSAMASVTAPKAEPVEAPKAGAWPWVKLDPQEAAERAFKNYHAKGG